jgi:hypothetical protein
MRRSNERPLLVLCLMALTWMTLAASESAVGQDMAHFQIVWVNVGEAASSSERPRAGRQLFNGPDLVSLSLDQVKVSQVRVEPEISQLTAGQRLCMTDLSIQAFRADGTPVEAAPLSISIRQDHRHRLRLQRKSNDICFSPQEPGEYPVRVTSLVPAPDGTMRGAQFFLRVAERVR